MFTLTANWKLASSIVWMLGKTSEVVRMKFGIDYKSAVPSVLMLLVFCAIFDVLAPDYTVKLTDPKLIAAAIRNTTQGRASGSLFNQVFWLALLLIGGIFAVRRTYPALRNLRAIIPLMLLVMWSIISILWSAEPSLTFRRSFFLLVVLVAVFIPLVYSASLTNILTIIYISAAFALMLDIMALSLPSGFHVDGPFKGVHGHKNAVGPVASLAIFMAIWLRPNLPSLFHVRLNSIFIALWGIILVFSGSKTSISVFFLAIIIVFIMDFLSKILKMSVGILLLCISIFIAIIISLIYALFDMDVGGILTLITGVEVTFTGRTALWSFIVQQLEGHWLFGFGYGGFWGIGSAGANITTANAWFSHVSQSHNGYLDLVVNTGIIGVVLFFYVLVSFYRNIERLKLFDRRSYFILLIIMNYALIHNLQETSLMRTKSFLWVMMIVVIILASRLANEYRRTGGVSNPFMLPSAIQSSVVIKPA